MLSKDLFVTSALKIAKKKWGNSYSPYSNYKVGAVIKIKGVKDLFFGCNVENASYGATVCAERVAVFNAISKLGKIKIEKVLILTKNANPAGPCGMCLQVLSEFCEPKTRIYLANLRGKVNEKSLSDLFPMQFNADFL